MKCINTSLVKTWSRRGSSIYANTWITDSLKITTKTIMQVRRLFVFLSPVFIVETTWFPKLGHMTPAPRAHATGVPSSHFPFASRVIRRKGPWRHPRARWRKGVCAFARARSSRLSREQVELSDFSELIVLLDQNFMLRVQLIRIFVRWVIY